MSHVVCTDRCRYRSGSRPGTSVQVGVGTRRGVDATAHAIATALEADPLAVACAVDCENAFNTVSRAAVFAAVQSRMRQLLPVVQWVYGAVTPLHVAGAPPGTEPILSRCGVRQEDPLGPLLFALALQGLSIDVRCMT
jgi:hypothetical protein